MAIISQRITDLIQFRIRQEEQSSRIYKAMATWLEFNGFSGAAKLFKKYSDEELDHASWAYKYLQDLNILPVVPAQTEPQNEFKGLPQIISLGYQHELTITNQCKELYNASIEEKDQLTYQLALKYINEQVGELGKFQTLLDKLESFGTDKVALRLLDKEMKGM